MKTIILSFGVLILFVGNIGVNIFTHICKEDGVSISYFIDKGEDHCSQHNNSLPPCCQNEEQDSNCCDDEVAYIKIKLDYNDVSESNVSLDSTPVMALNCLEQFSFLRRSITIKNYVNPPPLSGQEILILKQVFII